MFILTRLHRTGPRAAAALFLALAVSGCDRGEIKTYQVTNKPSDQGAAAGQAGAADDRGLSWTLPANWIAKAGDAMRFGSFGVTNSTGQSADISVIPLGGMAGGELSNVNRWRGQVGLPPVKEEELAALWEKVPVGSETGKLMDMEGTNPAEGSKSHILAAIATRGDLTWFFKMTGGAELVTAEKAHFVEFLKSIKFGGPVSMPNMGAIPAGPLPDGHPAVASAGSPALPGGHPPVGMPGAGIGASKGAADATPIGDGSGGPQGWVKVNPKPMQSERFIVKGDGGEAEAALSELSGDGGGPLPNVNRWRQQIGLAPGSAEDMAKASSDLQVAGAKATVVDITNEETKKRVVAVMVPKGGGTQFFKLMGDGAVVAREKEKFLQHVTQAK
jgi:hypothetical protein